MILLWACHRFGALSLSVEKYHIEKNAWSSCWSWCEVWNKRCKKEKKKPQNIYKPSFCIKPYVGEVGPEKGHFCFVLFLVPKFLFSLIEFIFLFPFPGTRDIPAHKRFCHQFKMSELTSVLEQYCIMGSFYSKMFLY